MHRTPSSQCQPSDTGRKPLHDFSLQSIRLLGGRTEFFIGWFSTGNTGNTFGDELLRKAPGFGYDPYGNPLQATAPVTDFNYAGMFFNADSGLYLTLFRAYDPVTGRWISRDPIGEIGDAAANLYDYVGGNPISNGDPLGLAPIPASPPPNIPGGPWSPARGQPPGSFFGPTQPQGPRTFCRWVPDANTPGGNPSAPNPYWKTQNPGQTDWNYFDQNGNPSTPDQLHPTLQNPNGPWIPPFLRLPLAVFLIIVFTPTSAY
jgi:RHS repeat-associated protein